MTQEGQSLSRRYHRGGGGECHRGGDSQEGTLQEGPWVGTEEGTLQRTLGGGYFRGGDSQSRESVTEEGPSGQKGTPQRGNPCERHR